MPYVNTERPSVILALPSVTHRQSENDCSAQAIIEEEGDNSTICNVCCIQIETGNQKMTVVLKLS